jgi:hypothetical protein
MVSNTSMMVCGSDKALPLSSKWQVSNGLRFLILYFLARVMRSSYGQDRVGWF